MQWLKKIFCVLIIQLLLHTVVFSQNTRWSIQQCIDTALKNNLTIKQSYVSAEINKVNYNQSRLNLLPAFNANANQGFNSGRSLNPTSYQFTTSNINSNNFSVSGSVTLFNGFQNLNKIKENNANYQASLYDYEDTKNVTTINVINGYLQVLYANEAVKNADSQVVSSQAQVNLTELLVQAGKQSESSLLVIKSQLATDKYTLVNAKSQLKTALVSLQQIMEIPVSENFGIDYNITVNPSPVLNEKASDIYQTSLDIMPSIKASHMKTMSQEFAVQIAKGALLPKLSLGGNLSSNYSSTSKRSEILTTNTIEPIGYLQSNPNEIVVSNVTNTTFNNVNYPYFDQLNDNFSKGLTFTLSIPIFNNKQAWNNIAIQKYNLQNARLNEQQNRNTLRKNIEQAYIDVQNAESKYDASIDQLSAENASYGVMKDKYDNGMSNTTDLLIEKNKLIKAQSDFLSAKYELILRTKILDYYNGKTISLQ